MCVVTCSTVSCADDVRTLQLLHQDTPDQCKFDARSNKYSELRLRNQDRRSQYIMPLVPAVGQTVNAALGASNCSEMQRSNLAIKWIESGIEYIIIKHTRLTKYDKFQKLMEGFGLFGFQHQLFECLMMSVPVQI